MSSRADYLSKYVSGGETKKKKKKPRTTPKTHIVKIDAHILPELTETTQSEDLDLIAAAKEGEEIDSPAVVESGTRQFKGFKRIDNGEVVKPENASNLTVFRDSSGRIVDINERRKEILAAKRQKDEDDEKLRISVNRSDFDKQKDQKEKAKLELTASFSVSKDSKEYNDYMKSKSRLDDPLLGFEAKDASPGPGRPTYNKGINPANRFGIKAGYFWDGVVRANGFEDLLMRKRNEQRALKLEKKEEYDEWDYE